MTVIDRLRRPPALDLMASAYKDWLHVNIFDHSTGLVGLCNVSLHGSPMTAVARRRRSRPRRDGWCASGMCRSGRYGCARRSVSRSGSATLSPSLRDGAIDVAAHLPNETAVDLSCIATAPAIAAEQPELFGSEWIARRASHGSWLDVFHRLGGRRSARTGRWGITITTWAMALGRRRRLGMGRVRRRGRHRHRHVSDDRSVPPDRLTQCPCGVGTDHPPLLGALCSHHADREVQGQVGQASRRNGRAPRWPDNTSSPRGCPDRSRRRFTGLSPSSARFSIQLITADPVAPGYGFIHELAGPFEFESAIDGSTTIAGNGIFEHVDYSRTRLGIGSPSWSRRSTTTDLGAAGGYARSWRVIAPESSSTTRPCWCPWTTAR